MRDRMITIALGYSYALHRRIQIVRDPEHGIAHWVQSYREGWDGWVGKTTRLSPYGVCSAPFA